MLIPEENKAVYMKVGGERDTYTTGGQTNRSTGGNSEKTERNEAIHGGI